MKILLFISTLIFLTKTSFSDEKMLALGDKEYGQHLAGECVTCHKANSDKAVSYTHLTLPTTDRV